MTIIEANNQIEALHTIVVKLEAQTGRAGRRTEEMAEHRKGAMRMVLNNLTMKLKADMIADGMNVVADRENAIDAPEGGFWFPLFKELP